jgi:LacI family transcriptional regulator
MKRRRVALLIESSRKVGRDVLSGIASYANQFGPWLFCHYERGLEDPPPPWLREWKPEGIIARIESRDVLRRVVRLGVPVVDVIYSRLAPVKGTFRVTADQRALVAAAADHLLVQGFQHFAFCGYAGILWSDVRQRQFSTYLASQGYNIIEYQKMRAERSPGRSAFETGAELNELRHTDVLVDWVRTLPQPIGLMACNDVRARQVLSACDEAGIRVPDEIGVIGVDNDELVCTFCHPPLSSVDQDTRRVGYEAAAVLDRLMSGQSTMSTRCPPPDLVLDHPVNVAQRGSTDAVVIADPELRELVRFIREHACEGLTLDDLVAHASLSRSTLQRWFAKHFRHSPSEEIDRVRLARIKELLTTTELPLSEIARLSGYEHFETLHRFFKAKVRMTPSSYREMCRSGGRSQERMKDEG